MKINGIVCRLRAEIDGVKYEPGPIKASEAEKITAWTGLGIREWEMAVISENDATALKALLVLDRFRKGEHVKFADVDIEDLDSVSADFYDERGRKVTAKVDGEGKTVTVNGQSVLLFDGEEDSDAVPLG